MELHPAGHAHILDPRRLWLDIPGAALPLTIAERTLFGFSLLSGNHLRATAPARHSVRSLRRSSLQAANIVEALEAGAQALLLDEDTCATNFMIRDARMQALVSGDKEPITPLTARIRPLAASGVSVILVMGGCGDYLEAADTVVMMDSFQPKDVTADAHRIAAAAGAAVLGSAPAGIAVPPFPPTAPRAVPGSLMAASGGVQGGRSDIKARGNSGRCLPSPPDLATFVITPDRRAASQAMRRVILSCRLHRCPSEASRLCRSETSISTSRAPHSSPQQP